MKKLRNSIKAIIISGSQILFNKMYDPNSKTYYYILPGGGQEFNETFIETLERECYEELGTKVIVNELVLIREYIGANHEHSSYHKDLHKIEYMFKCKLLKAPNFNGAIKKDKQQIGIQWINICELDKWNIYPRFLSEVIDSRGRILSKVYLGDIN